MKENYYLMKVQSYVNFPGLYFKKATSHCLCFIILACMLAGCAQEMCIRDRQKVEGKGGLFLPCPDRKEQQWVSWLAPFLLENPQIIEGTQCCGLGGCAGGKEPDLARGMACSVAAEGYEHVYTYCASCAGNLTRNGGQGVSHLLTEILDCHEQPDVAKRCV